MRIITSTRGIANRRRGVVLLVVMAMLALFASLALSFVFYADSEAVAAQAFRAAAAREQADVDRELLASYFLGQFLYDTDNVYSAMRGWSLARSLYGYNPAYGLVPGTLSYTPFNGADRATALSSSGTLAFSTGPMNIVDMLNYQKFDIPADPGDPLINDLRNPEYFGKASDGAAFRYVGGANPPWTAYDTNNFFLSLVDADGKVLMPSFHRPWRAAYGGADKRGRYASLRPHASWNPNFPQPEVGPFGTGYDVRNLEFGPGTFAGGVYYNNDSIWMDMGFPILTAKDGKRYKALFAPLVMDLSNRLHLWAHGNRIGTGNSHVSNRGMGVTEVNIGHVITNAAERQLLFDLKYGSAAVGPAGAPITFAGSGAGPFYSIQDFDGVAPLDPPSAGLGRGYGTRPMHFNFSTGSTAAVAAGPAQTMQVANTFGTSYGGFHWSIYPGMSLQINDPPIMPMAPNLSEMVTVLSVDHATKTFVAAFVNAHASGKGVSFGSSTRGNPYFPFGNDNVTGGSPVETSSHPMGFNFLLPTAPNISPLPMSQMEALLRHGGTNSPAVLSELFKRMPLSFANIRTRNLVTTHSSHLDRVTGSPVLAFDSTGANQYILDNALGYPKLAIYPPTSANYAVPTSLKLNSDFGTDWRSVLGNQLKVNLNRELTPFPISAMLFTGAQLMTAESALADRQVLAMDIYNALVRATGARDPNKVTGMVQTDLEYQASRWLAQFAVNIVDYIDSDDFSTPFKWCAANNDYVFGVEIPRAVLNEVYVQLDNDPADPKLNPPMVGMPKMASYNNMNFTIELYNPIPGGGPAYLEINDNPVHRVLIYNSDPALSASLRNASNQKIKIGEPDPSFTPIAQLTTWDPAVGPSVTLNGGAYLVFGPSQSKYLPSHDPNLKPSYRTPDLTKPIANPDAVPGPVTFLLQRLATPLLKWQDNPALPGYNPYVTIDYVDPVTVPGWKTWDNREFNGSGPKPAPINVPTSFRSFGRQQPLVAGNFQFSGQTIQPAGQPFNTFDQQNVPMVPAPQTTEWFTHLDRSLVNPLELLHVSAVRPHELTQQFVTSGGRFKHLAPWGDKKSMLYRALDLVGVPNHLAGTFRGGRHPGIINLNTVTERQIFRAICDPQDANPTQPNPLFKQLTEVDPLFDNIVMSRNTIPSLIPNSDGNPFRSFNTADLIKPLIDPLSPADPLSPPPNPMFAIGGPNDHPYHRAALLQKIYNNVTTTSNVFAVWWTVGFFEVEDETVRPARLGAEIGKAENRHIRHRFFAIVDRSGMNLFQTASTAATTGATTQWNSQFPYVATNTVLHNGLAYQCTAGNTGNPPATSPAFWSAVTMTITAGTVPITVQKGMLLEIGTGTTGEVVRVENVLLPPLVPAGTVGIQAAFTKAHIPTLLVPVPVICRGNPGPRQNYNPKQDNQVVLHLSVIQ